MLFLKVLLIFCLVCLVEQFQLELEKTNHQLDGLLLKAIEHFKINRMHSLDITAEYSDESGKLFSKNVLNRLLSRTHNTVAARFGQSTKGRVDVPSKYNIFLIDGLESFDRLAKTINDRTFDFEGYYLIVLTSTSVQLHELLLHIFQTLFNMFIVHANVIHAIEDGADMYTFFPFTNEHCNRVVPVLYNSYRNSGFNSDIEVFPDKLANFHGCSLNVVTWRIAPHVLLDVLSNGTIIPAGIDGFILIQLQSDFNFTMNFMIPESEDDRGTIYPNGTATGAHKTMIEGDGNLTICGYGYTYYRAVYMTASQHYYSIPIVIVKPGQPLYTSLERLFFPFDITVWMCLVSTFVISYAFLSILKLCNWNISESLPGVRVDSPMMQMFVTAIGGNATMLPDAHFGRILFTTWVLVNIIVRSSYQGLLFGFLQSVQTKKSPTTLPGLLEDGYKIYAPRSFVSILTGMGISLSVHEPMSIPPDPYFDRTQDPAYKRTLITGFYQVIRYNSENWSRPAIDILPQRAFQLPMVMLYKKHSYLKIPFDRTLSKLVGSGLIDHWGSRYMNRTAKSNQVKPTMKAITVSDFNGTFFLCSLLLLTAVIVLVLEILSVKYKTLRNIVEFHT